MLDSHCNKAHHPNSRLITKLISSLKQWPETIKIHKLNYF